MTENQNIEETAGEQITVLLQAIGVKQTEIYLQSMDRLMKMNNVQVNISNHPDPGRILQRARLLQTRQPGDPHPFVAPEDFQAWIKQLKANAEKKLEDEKAKEKKG